MKLYLWFYIGFQKAKQFWLNKYNSSAKIRCACLPLAGEGAQLDSLSLARSASMDSLPWSSSSSWPPSPTFTLPPAPGCTQLRRLPDQGSKKAKPLHDSKPTPNKTAFNSLFIHQWSCLLFGELALGQQARSRVLPALPTAEQSSYLLLSRQQL